MLSFGSSWSHQVSSTSQWIALVRSGHRGSDPLLVSVGGSEAKTARALMMSCRRSGHATLTIAPYRRACASLPPDRVLALVRGSVASLRFDIRTISYRRAR